MHLEALSYHDNSEADLNLAFFGGFSSIQLFAFLAWTNNLSDYDDGEYSDVEEEESDEEFNQKSEGNEHSQIHIFVSLFFFFLFCRL